VQFFKISNTLTSIFHSLW